MSRDLGRDGAGAAGRDEEVKTECLGFAKKALLVWNRHEKCSIDTAGGVEKTHRMSKMSRQDTLEEDTEWTLNEMHEQHNFEKAMKMAKMAAEDSGNVTKTKLDIFKLLFFFLFQMFQIAEILEPPVPNSVYVYADSFQSSHPIEKPY